jgi:hypothetical protein
MGVRREILLDPAIRHFFKDHNPRNIAGKMRFLDCVRELLELTGDTPLFNPKEGNWELDGRTADGEHYFRVVICDTQKDPYVVTFYQIDPDTAKKRQKRKKKKPMRGLP